MYSSCRRLPRQAYASEEISFSRWRSDPHWPAQLSTEKSWGCSKSPSKLLIIGWALIRITENDVLTSNLRKSLYLLPTSSYTATGRRQNSLVHAGIPNHIRYFCYQIIIILIIFKMIIIFDAIMLAWPTVSLFRCIHQRCLFLLFLWIVKDKTS